MLEMEVLHPDIFLQVSLEVRNGLSPETNSEAQVIIIGLTVGRVALLWVNKMVRLMQRNYCRLKPNRYHKL